MARAPRKVEEATGKPEDPVEGFDTYDRSTRAAVGPDPAKRSTKVTEEDDLDEDEKDDEDEEDADTEDVDEEEFGDEVEDDEDVEDDEKDEADE